MTTLGYQGRRPIRFTTPHPHVCKHQAIVTSRSRVCNFPLFALYQLVLKCYTLQRSRPVSHSRFSPTPADSVLSRRQPTHG